MLGKRIYQTGDIAELKFSEVLKSCYIDRTETTFVGKGKTLLKDLNPRKNSILPQTKRRWYN